MAVPTSMSNLSLTASSNSPAGTDAIGNSLDDYLRAIQSILRSTYSLASSSVASAASIDVAAADGESVFITGTTTVSTLANGYAGCYRELRFSTAITFVHSANLFLGGANITTQAGDVLCFRCISAGAWQLVSWSRGNSNLVSPTITGGTVDGFSIGFRGVPQTVTNATYTFASGDQGKCQVKNNTAAYTYTVPPSVFAAGDVLTVLNTGSAGNITLAQGAGVTLQLAGGTTTGARTVAPGCLATIYFDSSSHAFVSGAVVT